MDEILDLPSVADSRQIFPLFPVTRRSTTQEKIMPYAVGRSRTTHPVDFYAACLTHPIPGAFTFSVVLNGLQWFVTRVQPTPQDVGRTFCFLYLYESLQCPFEFIQGRRSAAHNFFAGGILGGLGVHAGKIGIPLVPEGTLAQMGRAGLKPAHQGFLVYGSLAFLLGLTAGKSL